MPGIFDLFKLSLGKHQQARAELERQSASEPVFYREPEEPKRSAEDQALYEQKFAARAVAEMPAEKRAEAFKCFDEMWAENDGRVVPVRPGRTLYHAGLIRSPDQVRAEHPMFVSPMPEGCDDYSNQVDPSRNEVRSATVGKTRGPLRMADFSKSEIDHSDWQSTPMGRLADLTGGFADKTRAHLARAWCSEKGLDGYERRNADELLIARPREALSSLETLSMEDFRSKHLGIKPKGRKDEARD